jgi:hypothetical protein
MMESNEISKNQVTKINNLQDESNISNIDSRFSIIVDIAYILLASRLFIQPFLSTNCIILFNWSAGWKYLSPLHS